MIYNVKSGNSLNNNFGQFFLLKNCMVICHWCSRIGVSLKCLLHIQLSQKDVHRISAHIRHLQNKDDVIPRHDLRCSSDRNLRGFTVYITNTWSHLSSMWHDESIREETSTDSWQVINNHYYQINQIITDFMSSGQMVLKHLVFRWRGRHLTHSFKYDNCIIALIHIATFTLNRFVLQQNITGITFAMWWLLCSFLWTYDIMFLMNYHVSACSHSYIFPPGWMTPWYCYIKYVFDFSHKKTK